MSKKNPSNISASVHQRLLNAAKNTQRPFGEVLQYFAMERFLHRLSYSQYSDSFVLKGALLFRVWDVPDSRATKDIDFLAYVENSPKNIIAIIRDICSIEAPNDGLKFDPDTVSARTIKKDADYEGVRVNVRCLLGNAQICIQIDVGFGDLVHPDATLDNYPAILDMEAPSLRIYPKETVIAEKVEAMVHLGSLNSRMKDFYDVWKLSQQFDFRGGVLCESIKGTFRNRNTHVISFSELRAELLDSDNSGKQWIAFLRKSSLAGPEEFSQILQIIDMFMSPILTSVKDSVDFDQQWMAPGPWQTQQL